MTSVKYRFISHIDKRFPVLEYIRKQIIIDITELSKTTGQVFGVSLHWKPRFVMTPILSSPGVLQVVIVITCVAHSYAKIDNCRFQVLYLSSEHQDYDFYYIATCPDFLNVNVFRVTVFWIR